MSSQPAYLFCDQQLVVNDHFELPTLEATQNELFLDHIANQVIVRNISQATDIPDGFHLVPIRELIMRWSKTEFEQASRAKQLLEWRNNHRYCSRCGSATQPHDTQLAMVCQSCHYYQYPRVQPCIITIIRRGDEILLAKSVHAKNDMYGLIAGFVEVGETLEHAVARETLEEIGIRLKNIQYLSSQPWPFPSNLMIAFSAEYESGELNLQEDEIADAGFYAIDALPVIPIQGSIAHQMIMDTITKIQSES